MSMSGKTSINSSANMAAMIGTMAIRKLKNVLRETCFLR